MKRVLIAGIGNIFLGDDAFGVEVVQALLRRGVPADARVVDFGIRGYDLAYALAEGYEAAILVDATSQGQPPGTLYVIEPDLQQLQQMDGATADAHSLNPVQVLQMAETLGGCPARLYLVGCEPGQLDSPDGQLGLSPPVAAAVPKALELIESLLSEVLCLETNKIIGYAPV